MLSVPRTAIIWLLVCVLIGGCGGGGQRPPVSTDPEPGIPAIIGLTSPGLREGGTIPSRYSCDGPGVSPSLAWSGVPPAAVELVLAVTDPDAPGGIFFHWLVLGLTPTTTALPEGGPLPPGARQAVASSGQPGYVPMCPPPGQRHHYRFTLYALRQADGLSPTVTAATAVAAVRPLALARGALTGIFGR